MIDPQNNNVLVLGSSGSGKSFITVQWMIDQLLPFTDSVIVTNIELDRDAIALHVEEKTKGELLALDVRDRLRILGDDVLDKWKMIGDFESGPWDLDLPPNSVLIIDEIGNYAHAKSPSKHQAKWSNYLGDARHLRVQNILITQNGIKLSDFVIAECSERWLMSSRSGIREPITGVCIGDLEQLAARFTGQLVGRTGFIQELNPGGGRWERVGAKNPDGSPNKKYTPKQFVRNPKYFEFYNSFSKTDSDGKSAKERGVARGFEYKLPRHKFYAWFVRRNKRFLGTIAVVCTFCVLLVSGITYGWNHFGSSISVASEETAPEVEQPKYRGTVNGRKFR